MSFEEWVRKIPVPEKNIDCQRMLAYGDVIHHGVVRKRRKVDKVLGQVTTLFKWKRKYVVLRGGCIYFYNDEISSKYYATSLYSFTSVERCDLEVPKEIPWPFKLVCALQETVRDYYFCAASEKDLMTWMKHIKQQIDFANGFPSVRRPASVHFPVHSTPPTEGSASENRPLPKPPGVNLSVFDGDLKYESDSSDSSDDELTETATNQSQKSIPVKPNTDKKHQESSYVPVQLPVLFPSGKQGQPEKAISNNLQTVLPPWKIQPSAPGGKSIGTVSPSKVEKQEPDISDDVRKPLVSKKPPDVRRSSAPNDNPLVKFAAAYWDKDSQEAEEVMTSLDVEGAFMVRESKDKSSQTLMVCVNSKAKKYKVQQIDKKYSLESNGPFFASLDQLIDHFKAHNIPLHDTKLTKPYSTVTTKR